MYPASWQHLCGIQQLSLYSKRSFRSRFIWARIPCVARLPPDYLSGWYYYQINIPVDFSKVAKKHRLSDVSCHAARHSDNVAVTVNLYPVLRIRVSEPLLPGLYEVLRLPRFEGDP